MKTLLKNFYDKIGGKETIIRLLWLILFFTVLMTICEACGQSREVLMDKPQRILRRPYIFAMFVVSFTLIMPRLLSRIWMCLIGLWLTYFAIVSETLYQNFRISFNGEAVQILVGTSASELREFFVGYADWVHICAAILAIAIMVVVVAGLARCKYFKVTRYSLLLAALLLLPWARYVIAHPPESQDAAWKYVMDATFWRCPGFKMWKEVHNSCDSIARSIKASSAPDLPTTLHADEDILALIVIGESATRNRMSLYGYRKPTTAKMDSRAADLFVFRDLLAAKGSTTESLTMMLSAASLEDEYNLRYFLPSACKRAGFQSAFFSNQDHWGTFDGADTLFFKDCDTKFWAGDTMHQYPRYDGVIIPLVKEELSKEAKNKVVFVHLYGSHNRFRERCPKEFAKFGTSNDSEHYDNSIAYTDMLLDELLEALASQKRPAVMIYLSDHGATPEEKSWRLMSSPDAWEVPFFIWLSDEYKARYPETVKALAAATELPLESDQLNYGFLKLLKIEGLPDYVPERDFLSEKFVVRPERYEATIKRK